MVQVLVAKHIGGLGDGVEFCLQGGRHEGRGADHGAAFKKWIEPAFRVKVNAKQFKMGF
jgi:hypothetical protein